MPGHSQAVWQDRIKGVEREFTAASRAAELLLQVIQTDPSILPRGLKVRDVRAMADNLEATYIIRLFAAFETGLRSYWGTHRTTTPPTRDLIIGIAALRETSDLERDVVQAVREYRNRLVHDAGATVQAFTISAARRALCTYFSRLPLKW